VMRVVLVFILALVLSDCSWLGCKSGIHMFTDKGTLSTIFDSKKDSCVGDDNG